MAARRPRQNSARRSLYIRLALFGACALGYLVVPGLLEDRARAAAAPRDFVLRVPLPDAVAAKAGIPVRPKPVRVVVAGPFSGWNPDAEAFRMHPVADGSGWTIRLAFPTGRTPYKFVLHLAGRSAPVWIEDQSAAAFVGDGFGGRNSICEVDDGRAADTVRWITGGAALLLALYSLFSWAFRRLGRTGLSATQRALVVFCLLLLVAGAGSAWYHVQAQRGLAREAYRESAELVGLFLAGQGVDLAALDAPGAGERAGRALDAFFRAARARTEPGGPLVGASTVHRLVLFDGAGLPVAFGNRLESPMDPRLAADAAARIREYRTNIFGSLFRDIERGGPRGATPRFGHLPDADLGDDAVLRRASAMLGFNLVLCPVNRDLRTVAYLGLLVLPQVYGCAIGDSLVFHAVWLALLLGCCLALFLFRPAASAASPELLEEFARRHGLTGRETELVALVATGIDYKTLADRLHVSPKTVKAHVYNIYQKTGVANRLALVEAIRERK